MDLKIFYLNSLSFPADRKSGTKYLQSRELNKESVS